MTPGKISAPGPAGTPRAAVLIDTPRLVLRVAQPADFGPLFAHVLSDAVVMRHVDAGGALDRDRAAAFFATAFDHDGSGGKPGVLVEKASGEPIGYAGPRRCRVLDADDLEIGFVLARAAWGRGYGSEIGRAQIAHVTGALGRPRALALAAPDNAASIATLLAIGMGFVTTIEVAGRGRRSVYATGDLRSTGHG
jgi:RimJ/RimL family protein N-acetyltransferase